MLTAVASDRRREVELGAPGAAEDHDQDQVERVERDPGREQADRLVGLEELGRREQPSTIQRASSHRPTTHERAHGGEPGDDQAVGAARLVVVGDRVGERRPGELEAAHEHVDSLGELDRERVQPRLGEAGEAHDQDPVDEVERVERELGRHRRQPEAHHPAQQGEVGHEREPAPLASHSAPGDERDRRCRRCRAGSRRRPGPRPRPARR